MTLVSLSLKTVIFFFYDLFLNFKHFTNKKSHERTTLTEGYKTDTKKNNNNNENK